MNRFKLFTENVLVYGLGGIISKIIPLIMVPIVIRIMPSSDYYGLSDLSNTLVSFASAIAIMGMYDAMYRMFFEKDDDEYKKNICSTTLIYTVCLSIIIFILLIVFRVQIADFFFNDKKYAYIVYLSAVAALVSATNSIISAPTRMQNKKTVFLITNTLAPIISYGIAIPMLLAGYYTIALPLAVVVSGAIMEMSFGILNHKWFNIKRFDYKLLKPLLVIALPLFPNFIIYWLFNSCDKIMITNMLGLEAAGIYSVGSKIGHCSQLLYTAFAGGWLYFAFSTMKEENQVKNNSLIFEYLGIISFIITAFICAWSYPIFKILFPDSYISGYIVAPYLFFAPLLQMLYQVAANQFLVIRKTWPNIVILAIGVIINVVINSLLIPVLGIEGASLATMLGYMISDIVCVIVLYRMKLIELDNRFVYAAIGMTVYFLVWRLFISSNYVIGTILALILALFIGFLYRYDLKRAIWIFKNKTHELQVHEKE